MQFKVGNFSIRLANFALFALEDYRQPLDRYRNGKPILRLQGPIVKGGISINDINTDFTSRDPRKSMADRFNSWNLFANNATPQKVRKIVRVKLKNGSSHTRVQNVIAEIPQLTQPTAAPQTSAVGSKLAPRYQPPKIKVKPPSGSAAIAALGLIAGAGGITYLVNRNQNQ